MNKMLKFSRKSQAALEFLMTYGWAILVVLVAIGALSYFGVLSPDKFLPSKCTLPAGIACADFKLDSKTGTGGTVSVVLRNGLGFDASGVVVAASGCTSPVATTLNNGEQKPFALTPCSLDADTSTKLVSGSKYNGQVNVTYTNIDSNLAHKAQGTILGRAE
ncbi:MAG: hypothetical protein AABX63_00360 [Nanoarchaeota archaeon]